MTQRKRALDHWRGAGGREGGGGGGNAVINTNSKVYKITKARLYVHSITNMIRDRVNG